MASHLPMATRSSLETLPWPALQRLCSLLPCHSLVSLGEASLYLEAVLQEAGVWRDRFAARRNKVEEKIDQKLEDLEDREMKFFAYHGSSMYLGARDFGGPYCYGMFLRYQTNNFKNIQLDILNMENMSSESYNTSAMCQLVQLLASEGLVDSDEKDAMHKFTKKEEIVIWCPCTVSQMRSSRRECGAPAFPLRVKVHLGGEDWAGKVSDKCNNGK